MAAAMQTARPGLSLKPGNAFTSRVQSRVNSVRAAPMRSRQVTRAFSDVNLIVGGSTFAFLALGRFVFLPFQRDNARRQGQGRQNGKTNFEAGDIRSQEASFAMSSNDPAGFNAIDVMAWGALGHVFAFILLATASNNYNGPVI